MKHPRKLQWHYPPSYLWGQRGGMSVMGRDIRQLSNQQRWHALLYELASYSGNVLKSYVSWTKLILAVNVFSLIVFEKYSSLKTVLAHSLVEEPCGWVSTCDQYVVTQLSWLHASRYRGITPPHLHLSRHPPGLACTLLIWGKLDDMHFDCQGSGQILCPT